MKDFDLSAFLADLRTLCAIDSGHFNAPGTAAVADFFESRYRALGLKTERRYYDNNDFAPFLTARNSEDEQIDVLFVAHMDTVFPVGTSAQWPLEVDADGLAHGPGCIDCKGGCLSLYYLLRQMLQAGDCRFRFCVAMNSDEERGSAYSRPYFEALAQKSRYCFVFEPGRPNEEFVSQRKGGANYIFKCHGISAHSGVEPEKGASAILELSRWVNELYKLNDFAAGTTVNVGRFDGGGDNGAVPDYAECTLSYRYLDASALDRLEALLQRMQAEPAHADGDHPKVPAPGHAAARGDLCPARRARARGRSGRPEGHVPRDRRRLGRQFYLALRRCHAGRLRPLRRQDAHP